MKTMSTVLGMTLVLTLPLLAPDAQAATDTIETAKVTRMLVTADTRLGGCMALLSVSPTSRPGGATCNAGWVTFDCAGSFAGTNVVRTYHLLDQAQLALATGKNVRIEFTDEKKANGYCFATRIDVF
jgi:hypothetical protein